jgi:hypothetical protein
MPPDEKAGFYSKVEPFGMLWAAHFEFVKAMLTSTDFNASQIKNYQIGTLFKVSILNATHSLAVTSGVV